jgi:hypothetical protein
MKPFRSTVNFTPSSTAFGSDTDGFVGVVDVLQIVHGHVGGATVVNDQL